MSQRMYLVDKEIDPNKKMLARVNVASGPIFNIGEVSRIFFARSPQWIRRHTAWEDEEEIGARSASGWRQYDLSQVEELSHALAKHGVIDGSQLIKALSVVRAIARVWRYLE